MGIWLSNARYCPCYENKYNIGCTFRTNPLPACGDKSAMKDPPQDLNAKSNPENDRSYPGPYSYRDGPGVLVDFLK